MQSSTFGSLFGCGISTVDFNGDGWDDVTVAGANGIVKLYTGGESGFSLYHELDLLAEAKALLWVDIENDGDLDLFAGAAGVGVYLFVQQSNGTLIEEGVERGFPLASGWNNRGISARDFNRDGFLDIYIASYHDPWEQVKYQNKLFQNSGTGYFEEVTLMTFVGDGFRNSFQGAWFDFDGNGFDDLWVINDRDDYPNSLYTNFGDGPFVDQSESSGANIAISAMSATLFDPDNDGDWDQYVTNIEAYPNAFMLNNDGVFQDVAESAGVASTQYGWGTCAIDVDGDRWDDMMVATYRFPNSLPHDNHLYMNDGTGLVFEEATEQWPNEQFQLYCLGRLDLDQDRVPDIVGHGNAQAPQVLRLTNEDDNMRLTVDLVGTISNTRGIGALIQVHADGLTQMSQVSAGEDFMTQHNYTQFFGLGTTALIDSLVVSWPSGERDVLFDVESNSALLIVENVGNTGLEPIDSDCPWQQSSWTVPFDPSITNMTWNGVPVNSSVVVADAPGEWTLEAVWWGTGYTWSQTVEWAPEVAPEIALEVTPPSCFGDSGLVSWNLPDSSMVTLDGVLTSPLIEDLPIGAGEFVLNMGLSNGCGVDTVFSVASPAELYAEVDLVPPPCAGDFGAAEIASGGGTGILALDVGGADLTALSPGVVPFSITDEQGCILMDSLVIVSPDSLFGDFVFNYLGSSDSVQVETVVSGGTPPYSWNWNGPLDENGLALAPVNLGWYVQDSNGCLDLGALFIGLNPLSSAPDLNVKAPWNCFRMEGALQWSGPEGQHLDVSVFDLSGKLVLEGINVSSSSFITLPTSAPVLVTAIGGSGELYRWLR